MSKLKLKPIEIDDAKVDLVLLCLGVAIIGLVLYQSGVFNGNGRVIEASDRFRGKSNPVAPTEHGTSAKDNGNGDAGK